MSTSCSPAPQPAAETEVQPFSYPELPPGAAGGPWTAANVGAEKTDSLEMDAATREKAAREAGRQEGEAKARAACDVHLAEIRESVRLALAEFARERARYFEEIETEVVRLSLSIARKILHREAQLDPLLLAGIVRVALGKIEAGTKVTVRVHPQQVSECRSYFAQHMESQHVPEVVEDSGLPLDHCVLETALGTTELGMEVQLKEIEQGLFDLMQQRPQAGT
ncbi:MAG TPA: FliH/SctL family protein [Terriglobales bacterium]|nr:FliH/SctL family protein [Terriglobales bacterium]